MKNLQTIKVLWSCKASIIASIALLLIAHTATAQVAQSPTFTVGDTFEYAESAAGSFFATQCYKWTVKVADASRYVAECKDWQVEKSVSKDYAYISLTKNGKNVFHYGNQPFANLQFPMQVGSKWSNPYKETYSGGVSAFKPKGPYKIYTLPAKLDCEVSSYGNINIALGKTMAYHIRCRSHPQGMAASSAPSFGYNLWYSPKCGAVVKNEHENYPVFNYEMSSCKLASQTDKK